MLNVAEENVKNKNTSKPGGKDLITAFSGVQIPPSFHKGEFVSNAYQDKRERKE